jgi:hypothetical protein
MQKTVVMYIHGTRRDDWEQACEEAGSMDMGHQGQLPEEIYRTMMLEEEATENRHKVSGW